MAFEWINDNEDHKKITTACHCLTILAENLNWQKTILNLKIFSPAMTMTVAAMGKKSCFEEKFISLEPEIFWVEFFSILSAKNIQRSYLGLWGSAYHLLPLKKSLQMSHHSAYLLGTREKVVVGTWDERWRQWSAFVCRPNHSFFIFLPEIWIWSSPNPSQVDNRK